MAEGLFQPGKMFIKNSSVIASALVATGLTVDALVSFSQCGTDAAP